MPRLIPILLTLGVLFLSGVTSGGARARDMGERTVLGGRAVNIWRPPAGGAAPLVIFSHGGGGCGTQSTFLTHALAEAGYLVVAPRHAYAGCDPDPATDGGRDSQQFLERLREPWSDMTLRDARDDILAVLAALKQDPAFAGKIDWSRLGLMGHSLGGHVVLGMAGAWPAWRLPEVKAVVALSPLCVPFLVRGGTLGEMVAPVQFQGGTRDPGITPSVVRPGGCYDQTSAPARLIVFRRAGHLDWTDPVTRTQGAIIDHARGFLDVHLRGLPDRSIPARRHVIAAFRAK